MANRTFENDGFWDRVEQAIAASGMTKIQVSNKMGVERKALYPNHSPNGDKRSWHSGRVASFCKITGVSADWLLGLSHNMGVKFPRPDNIKFKVIDPRTGKEPIFDHNHIFKEKWFKDSALIYCDIEGWYIGEDGFLILVDECGNVGYPPTDRFKVVML